MPIKVSVIALESQDGPWTVWDTVLEAHEIERLHRQALLVIDREAQQGSSGVVLNEKKIERLRQQLLDGTAFLGQLTWNLRADDPRTHLSYDPDSHELEFSGVAHVPDSVQ